ncbi:MAG: uracil-DNA glycosylase [Isosphaeraceae bacterium]
MSGTPTPSGDELDEWRSSVRQIRQRLESLRRAGVSAWPRSPRRGETVAALAHGSAAPPASPKLEPVAPPPALAPAPRTAPAPAPPPAPSQTQSPSPEAPPRREPVAPPPPAPAEDPASATTRPSRPGAAFAPPSPAGSLFGESGFDTPPVPAEERPALLAASAAEVAKCLRCPHLAATRTQTVYACGTPTARLMFIGEAPGADEDRLGQPFVGRAGQLLTDMITKGMGLRREDVYIANVLKCRPPDNRTPMPDEIANCSSYLEHQIAVVRPEFLCLLGKTAAIGVLGVSPMTSLGSLRRRWHNYRGIRTLVTYHPSYLLRTAAAKKDAWEDLQILMKEMGLEMPARKKESGE